MFDPDFPAEELAAVEARLGRPQCLQWTGEVGPEELELVRASTRRGRHHDLTFFVFDPAGRVAAIRKPSFPPGIYRAPSGGARPGEPLLEGLRREAWEETGLDIEPTRYLLRIHARFTCGDQWEDWVSHVFAARTASSRLDPHDPGEIAEARFVTLEELAGPIRQRMLATGRGLFRYRVALTDAALAALAGEPTPWGAGSSRTAPPVPSPWGAASRGGMAPCNPDGASGEPGVRANLPSGTRGAPRTRPEAAGPEGRGERDGHP
ncbi:NUDIX hydrolase [Thermaerobacter subterraneus]|uniref:ADP-ribose pyrophosphatase n=1 Tax=Thermaerobacter subterraneus DSM 13965 TaxID=867903 RepID=K6P3W2_9FIRM|nr:NUDIX hydrolase [Thermaerobacter subterraneus]EKP95740.1 ADP-ribose pyrophosphatase [Thermaerobacter subterraneus DSM 13965]